jgi:hypothetical protein
MPSTKSPIIPPFPDDIPTAPLLALSLASLRTSPSESAALYTASKELGFFYLDLRGDALGETLLSESDQLFGVGEALFEEGAEELGKFDYSGVGSYYGYKGVGKGVVDREGARDRNEFYNVGIPFSPHNSQSPNRSLPPSALEI